MNITINQLKAIRADYIEIEPRSENEFHFYNYKIEQFTRQIKALEKMAAAEKYTAYQRVESAFIHFLNLG